MYNQLHLSIAIIGAGLAGLTCAYLLQKKIPTLQKKAILNLHVFEATHRVGGRIKTIYYPDENLYAEAGAMLLTDNEPYMLALTRELRLDLVSLPKQPEKSFFTRGEWHSGEQTNQVFKLLAEKCQAIAPLLQSASDWGNNYHPELDNLDKISIVHWLVQQGYSQDNAFALLSTTLLGLYANDLHSISALDGLRFLSQYLACNNMYAIKGGNERLPQALSAQLLRPVILNTPITKITRQNSGWQLYFAQKDKASQFFHYVILATPLTLLQSFRPHAIQLPDLPPDRLALINSVSYNQSVSRVYCVVKERFWGKHPATAFTDQPTLWIEDHTSHQVSNFAILEAHAAGEIGRRLQQANISSNQLGEDCIAAVYGQRFREACLSDKTITFPWNELPFQQGTYPYFSMRQRKFPTALSQPLAQLYFAGDYTSEAAPSSMHGAVQSAHRVIHQELWPALMSSFANCLATAKL